MKNEPKQPLDYYEEQSGFNWPVVVILAILVLIWMAAYKLPIWLAWLMR